MSPELSTEKAPTPVCELADFIGHDADGMLEEGIADMSAETQELYTQYLQHKDVPCAYCQWVRANLGPLVFTNTSDQPSEEITLIDPSDPPALNLLLGD